MEHDWSEEKFDWIGLNDAGEYISQWLKRYVRLNIHQTKEKFGTLRIYCSFGLESVYSIWRPGYMWYPKWWPRTIDRFISRLTLPLLNLLVEPLQKKAYAWRYKKAVEKWPHLRDEIVSLADWGELFEGVIPGYHHKDYWKKYE